MLLRFIKLCSHPQVMLSLLFPPLVLLLGFRSGEELKTMPQTREEHQYDDPERSSDSESDTDSDDENMDLRNDHDPEVKLKSSLFKFWKPSVLSFLLLFLLCPPDSVMV